VSVKLSRSGDVALAWVGNRGGKVTSLWRGNRKTTQGWVAWEEKETKGKRRKLGISDFLLTPRATRGTGWLQNTVSRHKAMVACFLIVN